MAEVTTPNEKIILVAGATGQQGRALIHSLLSPDIANQAIGYHILALTRNPSSSAAKELSVTYSERVTVIQGDLDDPVSIRTIFESAKAEGGVGIWGVYSVLVYPGLGASTAPEERQGKVSVGNSRTPRCIEHTLLVIFSSLLIWHSSMESRYSFIHLENVEAKSTTISLGNFSTPKNQRLP